MILKQELIDRIKNEVLAFAELRVGHFLEFYPGKAYYAFAFDCNAEYGEVNLCFNTEDDFQDTLADYRSGAYADAYRTKEAVIELKFNTGDWEYQSIDTLYPISELELSEIFDGLADDNFESWKKVIQEILIAFEDGLYLFKQTETYKKIPKTKGFIAFCADHDENILDALARQPEYENVLSQIIN